MKTHITEQISRLWSDWWDEHPTQHLPEILPAICGYSRDDDRDRENYLLGRSYPTLKEESYDDDERQLTNNNRGLQHRSRPYRPRVTGKLGINSGLMLSNGRERMADASLRQLFGARQGTGKSKITNA